MKFTQMIGRAFRRGPSRKVLLAEIDRLTGIIADPEILKVEVENGGVNVESRVPDWAMRSIAASFLETLGDAPNWRAVEIGPIPSDGGKLIVTIQRANGKTPVETIRELNNRIDGLVTLNQRFNADCQELADEIVDGRQIIRGLHQIASDYEPGSGAVIAAEKYLSTPTGD